MAPDGPTPRAAPARAATIPALAYPELIKTERLTLQRLTEAHAGAYHSIWSDPTVWGALSSDAGADPATAATRSLDKQVRHWDEHGFGLWGAILRVFELPRTD